MIVLVTGITGLVGCHVAIELLRAGHKVVALVRGGAEGERRARRILETYPGYGQDEYGLAGFLTIEGDVTEAGCGLGRESSVYAGRVNALVHCAAHVGFDGAGDGRLFQTNVVGARHVMELAAAWGCARLVHVSTAYLDRALRGEGFRNAYERSKWEAEKVLAEEAVPRPGVCVVRPSIVTGDSVHGFTPVFRGIYPFLKYGLAFAEELKRRPSLPAGISPESRVNLVPADDVARVIRALVEGGGGSESVFNLINPRSWTVSEILGVLAGFMGVRDYDPERCRKRRKLPAEIEKAAQMLETEYAAYVAADPVLKTASTDALRRVAGLPPIPHSEDWLRALLRWGVRRGWEEL